MAKQPRLWNPKPHRAVDWNEKAIQKCIDTIGYVLVSPKLDGVRAIVRLVDDDLQITSREGIRIRSLDARLPVLLREYKALGLPEHEALDCELYIEGISFDEASGHIRRHAALPRHLDVKLGIFDFTTESNMAALTKAKQPLQERVDYLKSRLEGGTGRIKYVPHFKAHSLWAVHVIYDECRAKGLEGAVIKHPELPYRNGKVTGWWKLKPEITEDGVVVGYVWGTEGKANEGMVVGFEVKLESGETVRATGLSKADMQDYTVVALTKPYGANVPELIGRYCEVKAMERTASGKLRHPSFKCWRDLDNATGVKL